MGGISYGDIMKKIMWEHVYSIGLVDEIEIPDDFEINDHYTKWATLTLESTDGRTLEFSSDLCIDYDYKHPASVTLYDKDWNLLEKN